MQIAQKSGKPELETEALSALVTAYAAQGNIARAFELLRQQTNLSRKLPNADTRSQALISLGNAYVALGDYQTSYCLFTEALSEAQKIQFAPREAMAWQRLAFVAWAQGESRKAVERAEKGAAVAQDKIPQIEIQNNLLLSLSYGKVGDQPKAMKAAQAALAMTRQLQDRNGESRALTLLGSLHRRFGRLEEAIATYQSALALGQKAGSSIASSGNSGIYAGLARAYADLNQPQMAIVFYKQAINSIEDTRFKLRGLSPDLQQSFLKGTFDFGQVKIADIYRQLADLLISQGRIEEGQKVLELLKVQELRDFTRGTRSPIKLAELALNATEQQIRQKYQNLIVFGQRVKQCQPSECEQLKSQRRELQTQSDRYI
ncbi:tetratricopeptide repeat protein [Leptothermofonsia sp. ETS-13]|uniref:tetratricopeptide repeat protein n=1 Tax=Leptothermofonsia sp. ETS-13 TaxID=3035696 RepID=UPI003BA0D01D